MRKRENLPNGRIMSRTCFCALYSPSDKTICPVRASFPFIDALVQSGEKLLSTFPTKNATATSKAVWCELALSYDQQYSSRGIRRGASRDLRVAGSQRSAIPKLCYWRSLDFLGYVGLTSNAEREVANLLAQTDCIDSDDDVQRWG